MDRPAHTQQSRPGGAAAPDRAGIRASRLVVLQDGGTAEHGRHPLDLPNLASGLATAPGVPAQTQTGPLTDGLARRISYLRISLTDRCNYRCTYCMPAEGVDLVPRADVLSFEEIEAVVAALVRVGVRRVRLTGGEPTVRKDLVELVARLARLGLDDLALSTNGERLDELAAPLRAAGLHRLNVSLDTLDPERFARITRRGNLSRVLAGLEAVRAAGFASTKINTVAMRGFNDDEIGALCRYSFERGFTPRFIELMPMAEGALFYPGTFFPVAETRAALTREFGPLGEAPEGGLPGVGPARYATVRFVSSADRASHPGELRRVGLISAVTEPFCDTCNRVRLSATGELHACLGYDDAIALREIVRAGRAPGESEGDNDAQGRTAERLITAVRTGLTRKRPGHTFDAAGCGGPKKHMVSIGG